MKILVPMKQVADPDAADRVRISGGGTQLDDSGLERRTNPFDEYALETALRLTEDGKNPRQRLGEVIAFSLGPPATETMLRSALATGATRAVRADLRDVNLDARLVARALARFSIDEAVDWVIMGKQTVDGDGNEVGQRLASILDWPQATCAATLVETDDGSLQVGREVDGGVHTVRLVPPAVVTVDLRIVAPTSVRSRFTAREHSYPGGVRFAPLPAIMQARRKNIDVLAADSLLGDTQPMLRHVAYHCPPRRPEGRRVRSADELIQLLASETDLL